MYKFETNYLRLEKLEKIGKIVQKNQSFQSLQFTISSIKEIYS